MKRIFKAFSEAGKELYLVGGAVRDIALGIPQEELDDLDFCTNARPEESLQIIKDANLPYYDMGFEFGTVGAVLHGPKEEGYPKDCQVTTYRSEEYYRRGSRHPQVVFGDTIEQDLGRRDFSINSMAIDGEENLSTLTGGSMIFEMGFCGWWEIPGRRWPRIPCAFCEWLGFRVGWALPSTKSCARPRRRTPIAFSTSAGSDGCRR